MHVKKIVLGTGVLIVVGVAYYGISPLFRNVRVDEALPSADTMKKDEGSMMQEITSAEVVGTVGHPASGTVRVVSVEGTQYIRYENFKTINGPDIYVYLANDLDAKDFVNVGKVRATEGNINYEVPAGTDAHTYKYVLTWCKTFSVLFNSAKIN